MHHSDALTELLTYMLKQSDNLIADSLLKKLGFVYYHRRGSWKDGVYSIKSILRDTGINFRSIHIEDGSGLSRYNFVNPYQIFKLLFFSYHHLSIKNKLLAFLPSAGHDGTLAGRMLTLKKMSG